MLLTWQYVVLFRFSLITKGRKLYGQNVEYLGRWWMEHSFFYETQMPWLQLECYTSSNPALNVSSTLKMSNDKTTQIR